MFPIIPWFTLKNGVPDHESPTVSLKRVSSLSCLSRSVLDGTFLVLKVLIFPLSPYKGASVSGSPVSLGVLSGRSSTASRCAGTGLVHAHVGKEAAFTINCMDDTAPTVQVRIQSFVHSFTATYLWYSLFARAKLAFIHFFSDFHYW